MAENDPELAEELAEGEPPPLENLGPPPPKVPKPEECPDCPGGSPAWMATFADMATLLMAFFVLLLSFANVNVPKFQQVSGSLAIAFGVQRIVPRIEIPAGETLLSTEFTPSNAESTLIVNKTQQVDNPNERNVKELTEENEADKDIEADFIEVMQALENEVDQGQVKVFIQDEKVVVEMVEDLNDDLSQGKPGQSMGGKISQETIEIAKKITETQAKIQSEVVLKRPIEGDQAAEGQGERSSEKFEAIRAALSQEILGGLAEVEKDGDSVIIRLGQQDSFQSGSADLQNSFASTLNSVGNALGQAGGMIRVEGHTDNVPIAFSERFRSNWDLSSARSASVANYLLDNTPVEPGRVTITGFADSKPIADNTTAEGRAQNRRIEVIVDG